MEEGLGRVAGAVARAEEEQARAGAAEGEAVGRGVVGRARAEAGRAREAGERAAGMLPTWPVAWMAGEEAWRLVEGAGMQMPAQPSLHWWQVRWLCQLVGASVRASRRPWLQWRQA